MVSLQKRSLQTTSLGTSGKTSGLDKLQQHCLVGHLMY